MKVHGGAVTNEVMFFKLFSVCLCARVPYSQQPAGVTTVHQLVTCYISTPTVPAHCCFEERALIMETQCSMTMNLILFPFIFC